MKGMQGGIRRLMRLNNKFMTRKIEIIPAILPQDFAELEEKASLMRGLVKIIQIDACDGQFTPSPSWPYKKHDDSFEKIIHEDEGLPGWQDLNFEIDLMANKPEGRVEDWVQAGATRIIIHVEAKGDLEKTIADLTGRVELGLALNMDTPIEVLDEPRFKLHEGAIQFIQLMGIDHIGFQGEKFDEKVIGRIKEARMKHPALPIAIDGGVSLEHAPQLIAAGADRLVIGSAIFESDNFIEAVQNFKAIRP